VATSTHRTMHLILTPVTWKSYSAREGWSMFLSITHRHSHARFHTYVNSESPVLRRTCPGAVYLCVNWCCRRERDTNVLGPVPGVDVMAKGSQGWVQCENRHPYYKDNSCSLPRLHGHDSATRGAARSGPRFVPRFLALLAGYENLAAPLFALARQCKAEVTAAAPGGSP
jgi:hypothetical protein